MEVILITTLFSVLFAALFLLLFLRTRQNRDSCADRDALLPFTGDEPATARVVRRTRISKPNRNILPHEQR